MRPTKLGKRNAWPHDTNRLRQILGDANFAIARPPIALGAPMPLDRNARTFIAGNVA